tara:strand:- start:439 stop:690 length:252 start_codon:yes stop_codon:yes gene_type:complete
MNIFIFIALIIIALLLIGKNLFYSAKRNLFKDQAAWSGKDIKIKYNKDREISNSKGGNNNYLKIIAKESKIFLEEESDQNGEE